MQLLMSLGFLSADILIITIGEKNDHHHEDKNIVDEA
jgi:hypothetical protein